MVILPVAFIFIWSFNNRLTALETKLNNLPNELADRVDTKLANLRADLIKEFLSEAKKFTAAGNFGQASQAVQAAAVLTASAREKGEQASPDFFESAVVELTSLNMKVPPGPSVLSQPIHNAFVALADYRSSLEKGPVLPQKPMTERDVSEIAKKLGVGSGLVYAGPPGLDMMIIPVGPQVFENLFFADGWQTLDRGVWVNVVFINMHIKYQGGPVILRNVRFINCTFDSLRAVPHAEQILQYAAGGLTEVEIKNVG